MARLATPILLLIALLVALASAQSEAQWQAYRVQCYRKNQNIIKAIDNFCSKGDIVVPSNYANTGAAVGTAQAKIFPNARCMNNGKLSYRNPVWVPSYWCKRQFWMTCARGPDRGTNDMYFGGIGCQQFHTQFVV